MFTVVCEISGFQGMFLYSIYGRVLLTTSDRHSSCISENAAEAALVFVEARVLSVDRIVH